MTWMVDVVAKALLDMQHDGGSAKANEWDWRLARRSAKAAIRAMRTPTSNMLNEGDSHLPSFHDQATVTGYDALIEVWGAMIDEALEDRDDDMGDSPPASLVFGNNI